MRRRPRRGADGRSPPRPRGSATSGYSRSDTGDRSLRFENDVLIENVLDRECYARGWLQRMQSARTSPLDGSIDGANVSAATPTFRWSRFYLYGTATSRRFEAEPRWTLLFRP